MLDEQEAALRDLALITGGEVLRTITGHQPGSVSRDMLGASELAWLDRNRFGIMPGGGDEAAIEREVEALERRYRRSEDDRQRQLLAGPARALEGRLRRRLVRGQQRERDALSERAN